MTTRRNLVCENIVSRFTNILVDYPWATQAYRYVTREVACQGMINNLRPGEAVLTISEGTETSAYNQLSTTTKDLPITIEVHYKLRQSEQDWKTRTISNKLNNILGEVQKIMLLDQQCGNTALQLFEISNTLDTEGIFEDTVGFEVTFTVQYRHTRTDPTQQA